MTYFAADITPIQRQALYDIIQRPYIRSFDHQPTCNKRREARLLISNPFAEAPLIIFLALVKSALQRTRITCSLDRNSSRVKRTIAVRMTASPQTSFPL